MTNCPRSLGHSSGVKAKKLKMERQVVIRDRCGCCDMYKIQSRSTTVMTNVTTTSISALKLAKRKPHDESNSSKTRVYHWIPSSTTQNGWCACWSPILSAHTRAQTRCVWNSTCTWLLCHAFQTQRFFSLLLFAGQAEASKRPQYTLPFSIWNQCLNTTAVCQSPVMVPCQLNQFGTVCVNWYWIPMTMKDLMMSRLVE